MMRILVTGRTGQVAQSLIEAGRRHGSEVIALGRPEFDLAEADSKGEMLAEMRPDVIVSAAAYTAVDKAETDKDLAFAINERGPAALARAARSLNIPIIQLSTDYVFDGTKSGPYTETDPTNPLGIYGSSKLAGEKAVESETDDHVILRTAWVYSSFGSNFLKTMLRLASTHPQVRVVSDQIGNPTSAEDIAEAIITIAGNLVARPDDANLRGTFHMVGTGDATWADFAEAIFGASARLGGPAVKVERIGTADYPTPARRPANSRLNTAKLQDAHNVSMPDWRASTDRVVRRLLAAQQDGQQETGS